MNQVAIISGKKYKYVNKIDNIITNETAVLCKDECGNFYYCDIDEWTKNESVEVKSSDKDKTKINKFSTPQEKIDLYKSLFSGRVDVYAKRYYKALP